VTPQAVLFAEVREIGSDDRVPSDRAEAGDVGAPVDLAAARTNDAALAKQLMGLGRSALELRARQRDSQHFSIVALE
jgi:hypothetical protein